MYWFFAVGDVPPDLVELANTYWSARVRELAGREPHTAPAPSRGPARDPKTPKQGIQHKITEQKQARKEAKRWDWQVDEAQKCWDNGVSDMSWSQWNNLLSRREAGLGSKLGVCVS